MSSTDAFLLALRAYQEIRQELLEGETLEAGGTPFPLDLPEGVLLLGLGEEGLPLTLDLYDPTPGPLLVAGDAGSGKTALLQSLAGVSDSLPDVQFGVLTPFPEEWRGHEAMPNSLGIWPLYHPAVGDFLAQLVNWAEVLPQTRQVVLLLVDGLDLMRLDSSARYHLRWLLAYGVGCQIWPVVTLNPTRASFPASLLDYFETRILGFIRRPAAARLLAENPPPDLADLIPGTQFYFLQPQACLRFWLPPIEGVRHERWNAVVR